MPQNRNPKTPASKARPTKRTGKAPKHSRPGSGAFSFARIRPKGNAGSTRAPIGGSTTSRSDAPSTRRRGARGSRTNDVAASASMDSATSSTVSTNAFNPELLLTRRNLLIGAGVVGGAIAVGGVGSAVSSALNPNSSIDTISVPTSAVTDLADFNEIPYGDYVKISINQRMPFGSLVWADNDTVAACLCPTESSRPLNTIRLYYFASANLVEVLKRPQGFDEGFDIFDVRCSTSGIIWTECNIFENTWRIYTAQLENATLSNILKVDEGDYNWETPSIAACEGAAFWQVQPNQNGELAKEKAELRAVRFGQTDYQVLREALRMFACRIVCAADGVVVAPRLNSSTRYYQLVKINASDFSVADEMTLPHGMTPSNIGYGKSGFAFAFDNIYNYGDGIANLGTYTPMRPVDPYHYNDIPWFKFGRAPQATPAWCDEWFVVKSTRAICGVHFASKNFFMIDIPNDTDSYGEYLVSSGSCNRIVGLSQINTTTEGETDHALLRVFAPTSKSLGDAFAG